MKGSDGSEAILGVEVLSRTGETSVRVEAVVDTGFSGHLTLHPATVEDLELPIIGSAESILADGSAVISGCSQDSYRDLLVPT